MITNKNKTGYKYAYTLSNLTIKMEIDGKEVVTKSLPVYHADSSLQIDSKLLNSLFVILKPENNNKNFFQLCRQKLEYDHEDYDLPEEKDIYHVLDEQKFISHAEQIVISDLLYVS